VSTPGGPVLKVDPTVLRNTGRRFEQFGDELAALSADALLSDAASGVAELATGAACAQAQAHIATQMTSLADDTRTYGKNVGTAAQQYLASDRSSAGAIGSVDFSK
jgi:aconitase B